MSARLTLAAINRMPTRQAVEILAGVFENAPWVATQALQSRPFASIEALHAAMLRVVREQSEDQQLRFLRGHPELAGEAARRRAMTASSIEEQSSAGLDRLDGDEQPEIDQLNRAYRSKLGFPFIIAVRNHTMSGILEQFRKRLGNSRKQEVAAAFDEIASITRFRLARLVG